MALVWRLSPTAYAETLDGEGNRIFGARWNSPGRGVVYTCATLSLCVLETYVHFSPVQREQIPDFEAVQISVPDDAGTRRVQAKEFENILADDDRSIAFRRIGDSWLADSGELALIAPSVVVPEDMNVMLNPVHPRMKDVTIAQRRRFQFDPRLVVPKV
jgi:RES domain-containing protein